MVVTFLSESYLICETTVIAKSINDSEGVINIQSNRLLPNIVSLAMSSPNTIN